MFVSGLRPELAIMLVNVGPTVGLLIVEVVYCRSPCADLAELDILLGL